MALTLLPGYINRFNKNHTYDFRSDLVGKLDRKLINKGLPPLTAHEKICACTYTQWMPNLNQLAQSDRLKELFEQDLQDRQQGTRTKAKQKPIKDQQGQKKSPKKPAKGKKGKKNMF